MGAGLREPLGRWNIDLYFPASAGAPAVTTDQQRTVDAVGVSAGEQLATVWAAGPVFLCCPYYITLIHENQSFCFCFLKVIHYFETK
ncbi:MAG: hypothetical protein LUC39_06635 [Clostridiales bacterium]|nr:hypothetical protein [Clostridiales bacterium]